MHLVAFKPPLGCQTRFSRFCPQQPDKTNFEDVHWTSDLSLFGSVGTSASRIPLLSAAHKCPFKFLVVFLPAYQFRSDCTLQNNLHRIDDPSQARELGPDGCHHIHISYATKSNEYHADSPFCDFDREIYQGWLCCRAVQGL